MARLREHGAVFLGKTTTPEFGWKGVTDSPLYGVDPQSVRPAAHARAAPAAAAPPRWPWARVR